jgi:hypothetical protein
MRAIRREPIDMATSMPVVHPNYPNVSKPSLSKGKHEALHVSTPLQGTQAGDTVTFHVEMTELLGEE